MAKWQRIRLQCRNRRRCRFDPWVRKVHWRRGQATHSSILDWRIPWTEEPSGLQSIGSQRVRHDWSVLAQFLIRCKQSNGYTCNTLCDLMDCNPPGFFVHGILQARTMELVAISFSRGSSQPGDQTLILYHLSYLRSPYIHVTKECQNAWCSKFSELKTDIQKFTIIIGDVNVPCSLIDTSYKQKISNDKDNWNRIHNQLT